VRKTLIEYFKMNSIVFLCAAILNIQQSFAQTPKPMMDNVLMLTEAAAVLNVCFESRAYEELSDDEALELYGLDIRITNLVQNITKHYNHEALYLTYELSRVDISSDPKFQEYVRNEYKYCGPKLPTELEAYVVETEELINSYLSKAEVPKK
jgi:hypothetical protein